MSIVAKVLGQLLPSATTLSTLYTAPAGKKVTARLLVTNQAGSPASFRVAISKDGASINGKHYIAYDQAIEANDAVSSVAFALAATDIVRVYSSSGNISFSLTGLEVDL